MSRDLHECFHVTTAHEMGPVIPLTAGDPVAQRGEVACLSLWQSLGSRPDRGKEEGRQEGLTDEEMNLPPPLIATSD